MKSIDGKPVLAAMAQAIHDNKDYLGEIDGKIGDGDHGANMNKGFNLFERRMENVEGLTLAEGLDTLATVLINEIGGSMGPIYGTIFSEMAEACSEEDEIDLSVFSNMMDAGLAGLYEIVDARVGDKTLVDTMVPACEALRSAQKEAADFAAALQTAEKAAEAGRDSTLNLEAKYGRSSRLGKRSVGVLDAGATSCCLLLCAMMEAIRKQL